jgi:hypothetical protein
LYLRQAVVSYKTQIQLFRFRVHHITNSLIQLLRGFSKYPQLQEDPSRVYGRQRPTLRESIECRLFLKALSVRDSLDVLSLFALFSRVPVRPVLINCLCNNILGDTCCAQLCSGSTCPNIASRPLVSNHHSHTNNTAAQPQLDSVPRPLLDSTLIDSLSQHGIFQ